MFSSDFEAFLIMGSSWSWPLGSSCPVSLKLHPLWFSTCRNSITISIILMSVVKCRAVAYIPLTIMAVPASILTVRLKTLIKFFKPSLSFNLHFLSQLGGGYLFGLPIAIVADSVGATAGAAAAFLLGRTVSFWILFFGIIPVIAAAAFCQVSYYVV